MPTSLLLYNLDENLFVIESHKLFLDNLIEILHGTVWYRYPEDRHELRFDLFCHFKLGWLMKRFVDKISGSKPQSSYQDTNLRTLEYAKEKFAVSLK